MKLIKYFNDLIRRNIGSFHNSFTDDEQRYAFQLRMLSVLLMVVAFGMCVLNIFTHKVGLMIATGAFGIICIMVFLFVKNGFLIFGKYSFGVSVVILFTYFLITGGTEGFSPIWILLLPSCGFLVLGRKDGSVICVIMFIIVVLSLWTPLRDRLLWQYTGSFCTRFPLVFAAFWGVGYLFEWVRYATYQKLVEANGEKDFVATHDALTGTYNRLAFNRFTADIFESAKSEYVLWMLDVDHFKQYNDTYGHQKGDEALKQITQLIFAATQNKAWLFRWGGEEFIVLYRKEDTSLTLDAEAVRKSVQESAIPHSKSDCGFLTISIGVAEGIPTQRAELDTMVANADEALYTAKNSGRNRVVYYSQPQQSTGDKA